MKKLFTYAAPVVLAAVLMTTAAPLSFAKGNGSESEHGQGHAFGHFIAPGWLKKHVMPSLEGIHLPHGISEKLFGTGHGQDVTAPMIMNVMTMHTATSATIAWNTNEPATSMVYVSLHSPVDPLASTTQTVMDGAFVTNHTALFNGLSPSTTYFATIKVVDMAGNVRMGTEFSFMTDASADVSAPVINALVAGAATSSATLTWHTDENAKSMVYVSTSSPVMSGALGVMALTDASMIMNHSAMVLGLGASTTYHAIVTATDASGNTSTSSEVTFTTNPTPDSIAPVFSAVASSTGTSTAHITWTTNELSTSRAYVSTTTGFGIGDAGVTVMTNPLLTLSHVIDLSGLSASTTYYVRLESKDPSNNTTLNGQMAVHTM